MTLQQQSMKEVVPATGLEPAWPPGPTDFKSVVSTIPPSGQLVAPTYLIFAIIAREYITFLKKYGTKMVVV